MAAKRSGERRMRSYLVPLDDVDVEHVGVCTGGGAQEKSLACKWTTHQWLHLLDLQGFCGTKGNTVVHVIGRQLSTNGLVIVYHKSSL